MIEAGDSLFGFKGNSQTWLAEDVPMHGDPWASYDAWKPTPPDWVMPFHTRRYADETRWRMHRDLGRHSFFDGDESEYESARNGTSWRASMRTSARPRKKISRR